MQLPGTKIRENEQHLPTEQTAHKG